MTSMDNTNSEGLDQSNQGSVTTAPAQALATPELSLLDAVEFAENQEPRCPCVFLLDTSGSMSG